MLQYVDGGLAQFTSNASRATCYALEALSVMDTWNRKYRLAKPPLVTRPTMNIIYVIMVVATMALILIASDWFEHGKKIRHRHKQSELTNENTIYVLDEVNNDSVKDYVDLLKIDKLRQNLDVGDENKNEDIDEDFYEDDYEHKEVESDEGRNEDGLVRTPCPRLPNQKCKTIFDFLFPV